MIFSQRFLEATKKEFLPQINFILKILKFLRIRPCYLTVLSLLFGIISAFFLFNNTFYFGIFFGLHLLCDIFDGALARFLNLQSSFGRLFDFLNDRFIQFLLLLKYYLIFGDFLVVLFIFVLHNLLFFRLKNIYYSRTFMGLLFLFGFETFGVVAVGIISLYGLFMQLLYLHKND